jgi:serine/threonine-protein kinase
MLTDFGLAKDVAAESKMTRSGMTLGSPHYMPPEQADGRLEAIDPRSDVYALGATLYEMLVLRPPFEGESVAAVLKQVLLDDPLPLRKRNALIDRDLETICLKCLEKNPQKRYGGAKALAEDLERYREGRPILARPVSLLERWVRRARRNRPAAMALVVILLLLCAGGYGAWVGLRSWRGERQEKEEAKAKEEETQRLLAKSLKVANVLLLAQKKIGPVHTALKKSFYDSSLDDAGKRAEYGKYAKDIDAFVASLPPDTASQATGIALKGWLVRFSGDEEEAFALFEKAREKDAEVSWGYLFEAMVWLLKYFRASPRFFLLGSDYGARRFLPVMESEKGKAALARFMSMLEASERAQVLGRSSLEEFRDLMEGLVGFREGDFQRVVRGLTGALRLPETTWIEEEILHARARACHLTQAYAAGLEDAEKVRKAFPRFAEIYRCERGFLQGQGEAAAQKGEDPFPFFERALLAQEKALALDPSNASLYLERASVHAAIGNGKERSGEDPTDSFRKAIDDYTTCIRLNPSERFAHINRGVTLVRMAVCLGRRGEDHRPLLRKALADYDWESERGLSNHVVYLNRASANFNLARAEEVRGNDPLDILERAVEDCRRALELDPQNHTVLGNLSQAYSFLGKRAANRREDPSKWFRGEDPQPLFGKAIEEFSKGLRRDPRETRGLCNRGNAYLQLGQAQLRRGKDPRNAFQKGFEDLREVIQTQNNDPFPYRALGTIHLELASFARSQNQDPIPEFEKAISYFSEALRCNPEEVYFYQMRGRASLALGQAKRGPQEDRRLLLREAVNDLTEAIKREPDSTTDLWYRGLAQALLGVECVKRSEDSRDPFRKAIRDFDAAIEKSPGKAMVYGDRGNALKHLALEETKRGRAAVSLWNRAAASFEQGLALDPSHSSLLSDYGSLLLQMGQVNAALKVLQTAAKGGVNPDRGLLAILASAKQAAALPLWKRDIWIGNRAVNMGNFALGRERLERGLASAKKDGLFDDPRSREPLASGFFHRALIESIASTGKKAPLAEPETLSPATVKARQEKALAHLRQAFAFGWKDLKYLRENPLLEPLRSLPAFQALIKAWEEKLK